MLIFPGPDGPRELDGGGERDRGCGGAGGQRPDDAAAAAATAAAKRQRTGQIGFLGHTQLLRESQIWGHENVILTDWHGIHPICIFLPRNL